MKTLIINCEQEP